MIGWWKRRREKRRARQRFIEAGMRIRERELQRMIADPEWLKRAGTVVPATISSLQTEISSVPCGAAFGGNPRSQI